jgi:uncharacterized membrane protein YfcA
MEAGHIATLLLIVALAAYVQTVSGFALGLVLMAGVGLTGVIPIASAALLVTFLIMANAAILLARYWRFIALRACTLTILSSLLFSAVGYMLLRYLAHMSIGWVKLLLGLVIIASSLPMMIRPVRLSRMDSDAWFIGYGAIAGLMGGLFATPGPPLVYHFYRQPMEAQVVRVSLVTIFTGIVAVRLAVVLATGTFPLPVLWWSVLAVPATVMTTHFADRFRPPISDAAMRRFAFALLLASGLALALPEMTRLW